MPPEPGPYGTSLNGFYLKAQNTFSFSSNGPLRIKASSAGNSGLGGGISEGYGTYILYRYIRENMSGVTSVKCLALDKAFQLLHSRRPIISIIRQIYLTLLQYISAARKKFRFRRKGKCPRRLSAYTLKPLSPLLSYITMVQWSQ